MGTSKLTLLAIAVGLALMLAACGGGSDKNEEPTERPATAESDDGELDVERLSESVVMVAPGVYSGDDFEPVATGSGTVVDESGLILTNWHVLDPDNVGVYEDVAVYVSEDPEEMPDLKYFGGIAAWDEELDLAVVRVDRNRNGIDIDTDEIDFSTVKIGETGDLEIGDELAVLGYPAIGEGSLELTKGSVSGFVTSEGRKQAWIKTDARIAAGNSGGGAFDKRGRLVGIPTAVYYVDELGSEGSGRVRPVDLALELIEEAEATTSVVIPSPGELPEDASDIDVPLIASSDIGPDFVLSEELYLTNEDRASWYDDPEDALAFYEHFGRLGGVRRVFDNMDVADTQGTFPLFILAQLDLYETSEGAADALDGECDEFLDTVWEFISATGFEFYEPEYLSDPVVGEESCLYEAEEMVESPDEPPLILAFIGFRQGNVMAVLGMMSLEEEMSYEGLGYLASLQSNLIAGEMGIVVQPRGSLVEGQPPQAPVQPALLPPSQPPAVPPSVPTPVGYYSPEDAISAYLTDYGLWYVGDCVLTDVTTQVDSYCSTLYEDRGVEGLYIVGPVFSEYEACILVEGLDDGSWLAVDDISISYDEWGNVVCPW